MFKSELDLSRAFTPLSIAVLAVSDTRTLETDTAGALTTVAAAASAGAGTETPARPSDTSAARVQSLAITFSTLDSARNSDIRVRP